MLSEKGILFVISAPSGAGKTTLVRKVLSRLQGISLSVSCTTRAPRRGEHEGVDYTFISRQVFVDMVADGKFVEWAEVHGDLYGTPASNLDKLQRGEDVILEIDTQGARSLREEMSNGVFIFILPPSPEVLGERLRTRGGDSEEAIRARLHNAQRELDQMTWYDYIVVNDEIEEAAETLVSIIRAERCKAARMLKDNNTGGGYGTDHR